MEMYAWQKEYIEHEGDTTLRGGRQVGKSEAAADKIELFSRKYAGCRILITSPSERQENYIYEKVKNVIARHEKFRKKPTQHYLKRANGSEIFKFPVGKKGIYVEGLSSVDFLFVDEAKSMPEETWDAILPMLAEPKSRGLGWINLLSTTNMKPEGFFYDSFKPESKFKKFHWSAEDCPHISKEFLKDELERLGPQKYKMIWCGEFVEFDFNFFPKDLIEKCFIIKNWRLNRDYNKEHSYYLGIDPARFGKCKAAFVVVERVNDGVKIVYTETIKKSSMVDLMHVTMRLNSFFNFRKIFVDGGGVGGGLVDFLTEKYKFKIIDLNNAKKGETGKIFKEDLYSNLLRLMETNKLTAVYDPALISSLSNINYDGEEFFGKDTDLAEATVRACWCVKSSVFSPKVV